MRNVGDYRALRLVFLAAVGGCSASSSPASVAAAPSDEVRGVYLATTSGMIGSITFIDETTYWWRLRVCAGSENGCVATGTYNLDPGAKSATFMDGSGSSTTLPFAVTSTAGSSSTQGSENIRILGGNPSSDSDANAASDSGGGPVSFGGDATVSLTADASALSNPDANAALVGAGAILVDGFDLGSQAFRIQRSMDAGSTGVELTGDSGVALLSDGGSSGMVSTTFPAFTPWQPQVLNSGGGVMASPTIVTVTWSKDPKAATFEAFDDALAGRSPYWKTTTSEYGVGPLASGASDHVRMSGTPPTSLVSSNVEAWIISQASNPKTSGWPTPTNNTFYAIYLPATTTQSFKFVNQLECNSGTYGYHGAVQVGNVSPAYALIFQCPTFSTDDNTSTTSHELTEGTADPYYSTTPAFDGFDQDHLAWDILQDFQDEIADACENLPAATVNSTITSEGTKYSVQRIWSNQAAAAGHDPCVPAPSGAYFNVTPLNLALVAITTPAAYATPTLNGKPPATVQGLGYSIKKGQSRTIDLGFYSDGPTSGPWTLTAAEGIPWEKALKTPHVTLSLANASGQNGNVAQLTITVNAVDTSINGELVTVASTLNGVTHYSPILISN